MPLKNLSLILFGVNISVYCRVKNLSTMEKHSVSVTVIIPIYKVALYIARCAESLFNQSMRDGVEFIFVDDATPDNSINILRHCLEQHPKGADNHIEARKEHGASRRSQYRHTGSSW